MKESGDYGAVDAAAHRYGDETGARLLRGAVDGVGLEWGVHGSVGVTSIVLKVVDSTEADALARTAVS